MKIRHKFQSRKTALAAAVSSALMASPVAVAQDNDASESEEVDEIVVTGREFQQSLINRIPISPDELPFTLNTIGRDLLDTRDFTRPIEVLTTLPNIARAEDRLGTGTTYFFSRGFEAPTLVDNRVQNNFRGAGARDDSFVERYEVLKGPASIASGPVGAGGIINTVTKSPELDQFYDLKLRTDQFGTAAIDFDANIGDVGNSDTFLFRISGAYRDFQFDADPTKRETKAIRPVVVLNLGSSTSIRASYAYTEINVNPNGGFPLLDTGEIPPGVDTDTFTGFRNGDGNVEDSLVEAELNHEFLDNLRLTVRGSKQDTDFDYDNTLGLYNYDENFRLAGIATDGSFQYGTYAFGQGVRTDSEAEFVDAQLGFGAGFWGQDQDFAIGVAYDKTSFNRDFSFITGDYFWGGPYTIEEFNDPRYGFDEYTGLETFSTFDSKLNSVFAEAALRPSDKVTIVAGVRYDQLEQTTTRRGFPSYYDDSEPTFRLGATFELKDNLNLYASYAQAFVPQFGVKRDDTASEAETSDGVELGMRGAVFDGKMAYQVGVFLTDRNNVEFSDPNNDPGGPYFVVTAGEVRVKGVEFTSATSLTDGLTLNLNAGYTDIELVEADEFGELTEPVFPDITGSLYLDYEVQSGGMTGLQLGGGFRYVGDREGPLKTWEAYSIADVYFAYPITDGLDLRLSVLNVTDERYIEGTSTNSVNTFGGAAVLGPPRTAALTVRWRF